jgi:hypothetical protein
MACAVMFMDGMALMQVATQHTLDPRQGVNDQADARKSGYDTDLGRPVL